MIEFNPAELYSQFKKEIGRRNSAVAKVAGDESMWQILNEQHACGKFHAQRAYGPFIEDVGGDKYIDTALGAGTHILGHAHPIVVDAISRQVKEGTLFAVPNIHTYEVGALLFQALPHFHRFVFCNSGSEATMRAARIARAYTGKSKIAMFSGGWHGGQDLLLFDDDYVSDKLGPKKTFKTAGLPKELEEHVVLLPYNEDAAFDLIEENKDDLAMVIIEPSQGSNPRDDIKLFLERLRNITAQNNIVLGFDEIITGFRVALGGCQEYYGIEADIATYGKGFGGGLPIGMVAGKKEIMTAIKQNDEGKTVFMGGTFSANPLVMYVAKTMLQYLIENRNTVYPFLNDNGKHLRDTINSFCIARNIPVRSIGIGSMSRILFTDKIVKSRRDRDAHEIDDVIQKVFYLYLLIEKGIHVNSNRIVYLSTEHKKEHVEKVAQSIIDSLQYFDETYKAFSTDDLLAKGIRYER